MKLMSPADAVISHVIAMKAEAVPRREPKAAAPAQPPSPK